MKTAISHKSLITAVILTFIFSSSILAQKERPKAKTIIYVCDSTFAPYEFINDKGQSDGFCIELMQSVMKTIGIVNYSIQPQTRYSAQKRLSQGENDTQTIMSVAYHTDKKNLRYESSQTICTMKPELVVRTKSAIISNDLKDMQNISIMAENGSVEYDILRSAIADSRIIPIQDIDSALHVVANGGKDAVLCTRYTARHYIEKGEIQGLSFLNIGLKPMELTYTASNSTLINQINEALIKLERDGTIENLYNKWFRDESQPSDNTLLYAALAILAFTILTATIFNRLLRNKVKKETAALSEESKKLGLALNGGKVSVWECSSKNHVMRTIEGEKVPFEGYTLEKCLNKLNLFNNPNPIPTSIVQFKRKDEDSETGYAELSMIKVVNNKGTVEYIEGTWRDVTETIRHENAIATLNQDLELAMEVGKMSIFTFNILKQDFHILKGHFILPDHATFEELLSHIHPDDKEEQIQIMDLICSGKLDKAETTFRFSNDGDNYRYYEHKMIAKKANEKDSKHITGIEKDITDVMEYQMKLKEEMEKAQAADRLKTTFIQNMTHEIRTPLNAITGFSGLLSMSQSEEEKKEYLDIINSNSEMLKQLINDILDMSKIETNVLPIERQEMDLVSALRDIIQSARFKVKKTGNPVEIIESIPFERCIATIDIKRATTVANNLISNAIKYTFNGTITIGLGTYHGGIFFFVKDTGTGIPKEKQHLLFNRFEKLGSYTQGNGLGLALSKAIIDASHGRIGMRSKGQGKGCTFWAWIPKEAKTEFNQNSL